MKHILLCFILSLPLTLFGQDTTFYTIDHKKTNHPDSIDFYSIETHDQNDTDRVEVRYISKAGRVKGIIHYSSFSKFVMDGELVTYWDNGKLKRKDAFDKGKLLNGACYDSNGVVVPYYDYQVMPKFPGGDMNLLRFIQAKLNYPVEARDNGFQGRVIIRFMVDKNGNVKNAVVYKPVYSLLDEEALRVVSKMPKWEPGRQDGEAVDVWYTVPIIFSLGGR